jgi:23S rRNA pseudouridine1911/1915/1917 synthase
LLKIADEARAERVTEETPGAKHAALHYRVLQFGPDWTMVEFRPLTGRMHQIRVQAAARGCPVLGDLLYGAVRPFGPPAELPRDRIIALHARSLTFLHPIRYEPITLSAPLPQAWHQFGPSVE